MSRSNNTELANPSNKFFEWSGGKGNLKYFDKSKGEKGEQIQVSLPFSFLVLDKLSAIKGFSDQDQSGFWSNEVRSTLTEKFTVRTKKGIIEIGLYKQLTCLAKGAQYSQSVYIAYFEDNGELSIGNLQLSGSAIGPWIDLCKGKDIYKYGVTITGVTEAKKGATVYYVPVFKLNPVLKPETENKAIELDKELQEYLKAYFNRNNTHEEIMPEVEYPKNIKPVQAVPVRPKGDFGYDGVDVVPQFDDHSDSLPF